MTHFQLQDILSDFPKFELSYEIIGHKKVLDADIVMAIPQGKKAYAWFTTYKSENVCFVLELNENNAIVKADICITSFKDELSYGTLLYGTLFSYEDVHGQQIQCFCVEDILFWKEKNVNHFHFIDKLKIVTELFKENISQTVLHKKYMLFGLPIMNNDFSSLLRDICEVSYKIETLKFRYYETKKIVTVKYYKPNVSKEVQCQQTAVFKVTADVQNDIYNLFVYDENDDFYDVAFITDYTTSVMMNNLFRNIKENKNLDALEESDDEQEFESDRIDKYVDLQKSYKMICKYNPKFKKWMPISLAKNEKLVTRKYLKIILQPQSSK
jgi:hypothetical protein